MDDMPAELNHDQRVQSYERCILFNLLEECRWNYSEGARRSGLTYRMMRYRVTVLGISHNPLSSNRGKTSD